MRNFKILVFTALLLLPGMASAQRAATQTAPVFTLIIQVNVPDAIIFVDGNRMPTNRITLPRGDRVVRVTAPGYQDFTTTVNLMANMTLPVTLQPLTAVLTIQVNVPNASIFVDGAMLKGNQASVNLGNRTIRVTAPGYIDFNTTVSMTSNMTLPVTLQPLTFQVRINAANVQGAEVYINNRPAGRTPFVTQLPEGRYMLAIQAPGFISHSESFAVGPERTINVNLQPATATVNFQLPATTINSGLGGKHWDQITIHVDGVAQKGNVVIVQPGKRLIKVVAGGLQAEMVYDFLPGMTYTFEPFMGINIRNQ